MIRHLWALGAAVPKLCALGLVCGPIPLFMGTVIVPRVIRYFGESKKEKIKLGITDSKLKIIVNHIDSDFVNDSEKVKQALSEIERSIFYLGFITNPKNGRVKGLKVVSLDRTYWKKISLCDCRNFLVRFNHGKISLRNSCFQGQIQLT